MYNYNTSIMTTVTTKKLDPVNSEFTTQQLDDDNVCDPNVESEGKRQQIYKFVDLEIAPARVKRRMDIEGINKLISAETLKLNKLINVTDKTEPLREALKVLEFEKVDSDEEIKDKKERIKLKKEEIKLRLLESREGDGDVAKSIKLFEEKKKALTKERIRFSSDASVVISIIYDELAKQLVKHSMKQAFLIERKIITVKHLRHNDIRKLPLFPLIEKLPSFLNPPPTPSREKGANKKVDPVEKVHDKTSFVFYVAEIFKHAIDRPKVEKKKDTDKDKDTSKKLPKSSNKKTPKVAKPEVPNVEETKDPLLLSENKYQNLRVSTHIKQYLSDLLIELTARIVPLIQIRLNYTKGKTVNSQIIMNVVQGLLTDGGSYKETLSFSEQMVSHSIGTGKFENVKNRKGEFVMVLDPETNEQVNKKKEVMQKEDKMTMVAEKKLTFIDTYFYVLEETVNRKLKLYNEHFKNSVAAAESQ